MLSLLWQYGKQGDRGRFSVCLFTRQMLAKVELYQAKTWILRPGTPSGLPQMSGHETKLEESSVGSHDPRY